jgi:hypothetical protein
MMIIDDNKQNGNDYKTPAYDEWDRRVKYFC